ncbi:MAG: hypothetical protein ACREBJ_07775 [Nitrosotalea sp.]
MSENSFLRDPFSSLCHRLNDKKCYLTDGDMLMTQNQDIENIMVEYGQLGTVALIDYKRCVFNEVQYRDFGGEYGAIRHQSFMCQYEYKRPKPFFVVLGYLDCSWTDKMYYVIPCNFCAKEFFLDNESFKQSLSGAWMTPKFFSIFQSKLRNEKWNAKAVINDNVINSILKLDPNFPIWSGMSQQDLPNIQKIHPLPKEEFLQFVRSL